MGRGTGDNVKFERIGVAGGGAWGTALAQAACIAGRDVTLWARDLATVMGINQWHGNPTYLQGVMLDPALQATDDLALVAECDGLLLAVPAQHIRTLAERLRPHVRENQPVIVCAKGVEKDTGLLMGEVVAEVLPAVCVATLSGPSFAHDVARGLPTAVTIACRNETLGRCLAESLGSRCFRIYWTDDITGADIGGALKNVLAIAAGIVEGRALGASAHAAMVTRGFSELRRFGMALGARPETLMGLSGLGDLVLTCGSPQSRNMALGRDLGQGKSFAESLSDRHALTEGVHTAAAVVRLARERGIEMPIAEAVLAVIEGRATIDDAIDALLSRPLKAEG